MKYFIFTLLLIVSIIPFVTFAQSSGCAPGSGNLCNPLKYNTVQELIPKLLDLVAQVGLIVCTFFIILAGFKYVTANGDPKKITDAHSILLWSVVGTVVLLGAKVISSILANTVNQIIK
jgi:TRAP-type C4-dicarboxylate transport system permease small subunit